MNFKKSVITIEQFPSRSFDQANLSYLKKELKYSHDKSVEVVLLSVQDVRDLKQAYPNYFMDTTEFSKHLKLVFDLSSVLEKADSITDDVMRQSTIDTVNKLISDSFKK